MFDETVCLTEGCTDPCTDGQRFCCRCLSENERERLHTVVIEELHASSVWENRNFSLMSFRNEDFSEKLIFASSFYGVIFENCRFDRSRFFACFFEKAVFINCSFKETESKYNIVGNSTIQNTSFAGSDILFSNFIGALIENTDFSETDLYSSTFFRARLKQVNFSNCNLKKTDFRATKQESVLFRYSNYEEAFFDGGSVLLISILFLMKTVFLTLIFWQRKKTTVRASLLIRRILPSKCCS